MSAVEKFPCGCVGVRIAPRTAVKFKLCIEHGDTDGRPRFLVRGVPAEKGTSLSLASKEWEEIERGLMFLVDDAESWRDLARLVGSLTARVRP